MVTCMSNDVPKRQCFVGLLDILGYSDIVKNSEALESVWKTYSEIKSSASFIKANLESLLEREIINVDTFSDTFLLYTSDYSNKGQKDIDELFNAMLGVCDALFHSANSNGIPIRGAITAGEIIIDKGIHIGKPIVDAYEMEQNQDWIGCWISDDAIARISKELIERHMNGNLILKYEIPFKSGEIRECCVFNWVNFPDAYDFGIRKKKRRPRLVGGKKTP